LDGKVGCQKKGEEKGKNSGESDVANTLQGGEGILKIKKKLVNQQAGRGLG